MNLKKFKSFNLMAILLIIAMVVPTFMPKLASAAVTPPTRLKVGSHVVMGKYKAEPLRWVVLKNDENGVYLLNTKNVRDLTRMQFDKDDNNNFGDNDWKASTLRSFLNNQFFNHSFNEYQKSIIVPVNYKYFTGNKGISITGSDNFYVETDWSTGELTTNRDIAFSNYSLDKVSIPSMEDVLDTNMTDYFQNIKRSAPNEDVNYITRDAEESKGIYSIGLSMYDEIEIHRANVNVSSYVRPVLYIKSNATISSGAGTETNPYFIGQSNVIDQPLVVNYPDIHITNDMLEEDVDRTVATFDIELPSQYIGQEIELYFGIEDGYTIFRLEDSKNPKPIATNWGIPDWSDYPQQVEIFGELYISNVSDNDSGGARITDGIYTFIYTGEHTITLSAKKDTSWEREMFIRNIKVLGHNYSLNGLGDIPSEPVDPSLTQLQVGDHIAMGEFNNELLNWVVLKNDEGGSYLINTDTLTALSDKVFTVPLEEPDFYGPSTNYWENSTIREFLNNEFFNNAFTNSQKENILNQRYKAYLGNYSDQSTVGYDYFNIDNLKESYAHFSYDYVSLPSRVDIEMLDESLLPLLSLDFDVDFFTRDCYDWGNVTAFSYGDYTTREFNWYTGKYYDVHHTGLHTFAIEEEEMASVRPVIYIKSGINPIIGDGGIDTPYVIE